VTDKMLGEILHPAGPRRDEFPSIARPSPTLRQSGSGPGPQIVNRERKKSDRIGGRRMPDMPRLRLTVAAGIALLIVGATVSPAGAQRANPRFGRWKLKSDAPPPASNVMTYAPEGANGMKVTIDAVNKDGVKSQWYYSTRFDGKDEPVTGNPGSDTAAVTIVNDAINTIVYKKAGKVSQILTNVLSPDGSVIGVMYMRPGDGKTTVTYATYERLP
jgi:hypothetical protein